jgi:hypothetical protein
MFTCDSSYYQSGDRKTSRRSVCKRFRIVGSVVKNTLNIMRLQALQLKNVFFFIELWKIVLTQGIVAFVTSN